MQTTSSALPLAEAGTWSTMRSAALAWCLLLATDAIVYFGGAPALIKLIRACPVRRRTFPLSGMPVQAVLHAQRHAGVFAFHRYRCLKYWGAATCLLRLHGHQASFVIGVKRHPFQSHAWLEHAEGNAGLRPYERASEWVVITRV
jgi:hypothetical protein